MMLTLGPGVADTIRSTSRRAYPEEGCGYLIGEPGARTVLEARATRNVHPGPRESRYLVDPLEFMDLDDSLEQQGLAIVGIFHSHPGSAAVPSPTDLKAAIPDLCYVIHDVRNGQMGALRAWQLDATGRAFDEVRLADPAPEETK